MTACWVTLFLAEIFLCQPFDEGARVHGRLLHVIEIVCQAVFVHTGCACASTWARNLAGKSAGVNTSICTPSTVCSSS